MRKALNLITSNIPVWNLRREFEEYLKLFRSRHFCETVFNSPTHKIEIPSLSWHGLPNDLLTLMLQRSILGLECYVSAAVDYELARTQRQCEEERAVQNPFSLDRNVVVAVYEKLPARVSDDYKLSTYSRPLYTALREFYKKVRNPLFHGSQVSLSSPDMIEQVRDCFELLAEVYDWIDTWYSAFPHLYKGK